MCKIKDYCDKEKPKQLYNVAEENDLAAETYELLAKNNHNAYERLTAETNSSRCAECAADHRQLAEWLQELKQWRENPFKMINDICANQFDCCNCPIGGYCRADDWFGYPSEWEVE